MENKIFSQLCSLGITKKENVREIFPRVRDREDISVLQDKKSKVIFLSRSNHVDLNYYENQDGLKYWFSEDRGQAKKVVEEDDVRRSKQFKSMIEGMRWLDCGTGVGGILDLLGSYAKEVYAIEPQRHMRNELIKEGYEVFSSVAACPLKDMDIVTLFHVVEHFVDPINTFKEIKDILKPGGKIIIEVPHSRDILITLFNLKSFKDFTFWSEHLILHTKESIEAFLVNAGFKNITVEGCQRYPLANHLYWILKGKPGGHKKWTSLRINWLEKVYTNVLKVINRTDTIIAYGEK